MIQNFVNNQNELRNLQQMNNTNLSKNVAFNNGIKNNVENKTDVGIQKKDVSKSNSTDNKGECKTCSERRYQDGSSDSGVSFKTPTKLTPDQASSAVISHEKEHYTREAQAAENENKDVLVNSIRLESSICPDCGRSYISGGETTTVTRTRPNNSPSPVTNPQTSGLKLDIGV